MCAQSSLRKCTDLPEPLLHAYMFDDGGPGLRLNDGSDIGCCLVDVLFYVPPIVCRSSVFVLVLVCITLCPVWFCNHFEWEERVGCFSFRCLVTINVMWLYLMVLLMGYCGIS